MKTHAALVFLSQLLLLQLSGAVHAIESTPEVRLMRQVIALQGESSLSQPEIQTRLKAAVSSYVANSSSYNVQERDTRMRDALVSLGVETPEQASEWVSEITVSATRVQEAASAGDSQQAEVLNSELARLIQIQPQGAQFSSCQVGAYVWVGLLTGGVLTNVIAPSGSHASHLGVDAFYASIIAGLYVGAQNCRQVVRDLSIHVGI